MPQVRQPQACPSSHVCQPPRVVLVNVSAYSTCAAPNICYFVWCVMLVLNQMHFSHQAHQASVCRSPSFMSISICDSLPGVLVPTYSNYMGHYIGSFCVQSDTFERLNVRPKALHSPGWSAPQGIHPPGVSVSWGVNHFNLLSPSASDAVCQSFRLFIPRFFQSYI